MKRYLRSHLSQAVAAAGLLLLILAFTGAPATAEDPPITEADLQYDLLLQDLGRRDGNVEPGVFGAVATSSMLHGFSLPEMSPVMVRGDGPPL